MDELDINQTIAVTGYGLGRTPVSLAVRTLQLSKLDEGKQRDLITV